MSSEKIITATELEDFDEVDVVEVLVSPGDKIELNQSVVTLESDKAMMEFPASAAGIVKTVSVVVGDKVKQGDVLLTITSDNENNKKPKETVNDKPQEAVADTTNKSEENNKQQQSKISHTKARLTNNDSAYASPSVRKYAKELGVDLDKVSGRASKGRILKDDVNTHVKKMLSSTGTESKSFNYSLPDFSKFGEVEEKKLNKLKQVAAQHLHHAWNVAPHVTQFDEADITDLEMARKQLKQQVAEQGGKLTLLPFIMKALVKCLEEFPDFNSSLNHDITALIHKKFYNIGVAVDTPRGLVVPVINDVDKIKIPQLAKQLMEVSDLARDNKLKPSDMQGGCMTITSLGGIGGQHFTPIINFPEVAILGVSRTQIKLVKGGSDIEERLMLPLSLSYDHRAIDGVLAVKFISSLKNRLSDVWTLMI